MTDGILSTLGTYDIRAKALPGASLILGICPLLPYNSLPTPELTQNGFVFIVTVLVILILGFLLGEVVHTVAISIEQMFAWIGRRLRIVAKARKWVTNWLQSKVWNSEGKPNQINQPLDDDEAPQSGSIQNRGPIKEAGRSVKQWLGRRKSDIVFVAIDHRIIFTSNITGPFDFPNPKINLSEVDKNMLERNLIKFAQEHNIEKKEDVDDLYRITVDRVIDESPSRASTFQAKYSFCRGMGVVVIGIAAAYLGSVTLQGWIPEALMYNTYLHHEMAGISDIQVTYLSVALAFISLAFFIASGRYKRHYINYLLTGLYNQQQPSQDK